MGIGDWGLGPIPNPQSPIPNPQSPNLEETFESTQRKNNLKNNKFINDNKIESGFHKTTTDYINSLKKHYDSEKDSLQYEYNEYRKSAEKEKEF